MTTRIVLVDWLGRGGIAHCSEAWALTLGDAGLEVTVVTRPSRELGAGAITVDASPTRRSALAAHLALCDHAAKVIERVRPHAVIIQNYVIPPMEARVHRAARRAGARLAVVVHDHQLHSRAAGTNAGLTKLLRRADVVVAHSRYVGDAVETRAGRPVQVIPLPVQLGLVRTPAARLPFQPSDELLAVHFGTLRRGYKGTSVVTELAQSVPAGWRLAVLGLGATSAPGVFSVDRFLEPGELVAAVKASDATVLPYRWATQSGAVVLAQALESVAVVTAVGGLAEQVEDGRTGLVLPLDAPLSTWRAALERLSDPAERAALAAAGHAHAWDGHKRFEEAALTLAEGR